MDFQRKVEIDELQELEVKQKSDLEIVLESEEAPLEPILWAIDEIGAEAGDTVAADLVQKVHDLMADDVAALVQEHVIDESEDDIFELDTLMPNFYADSAIATEDERDPSAPAGAAAPAQDDAADFIVSSANRSFFDDGDPWNGGGGGGGGGGGNPPPTGGGGDGDAPPAEPPPKKPKADATAEDKKPLPAKPTSKKPPGGDKGK